MSKKIKLDSVFYTISEPLKSILTTTSSSISHPRTKGDASEFQWLKWLRTYLPKRYKVDNGFVIDSNGCISEQQDIIIYDQQYTPYLLNEEGIIYITAESVYGVIEVKQKLNREYIMYTGDKIKSVRCLERTSVPVRHLGGIGGPKELHTIIGGLVCLACHWKKKLDSSYLVKALEQVKEPDKQIDIICCLEDGSCVMSYERDTIELRKSTRSSSLVFFFINLMSKLQDIGTVPAMDYNAYAKSLEILK